MGLASGLDSSSGSGSGRKLSLCLSLSSGSGSNSFRLNPNPDLKEHEPEPTLKTDNSNLMKTDLSGFGSVLISFFEFGFSSCFYFLSFLPASFGFRLRFRIFWEN